MSLKFFHRPFRPPAPALARHCVLPGACPRSQGTVRYFGVLAPAAKWRPLIVPKPGPSQATEHGTAPDAASPCSAAPCSASGSHYRAWAELLRRTFAVDVETCPRCGGRMRLLAVITDLTQVARFLHHRREPTEPPARAPPRDPPYFKTLVGSWPSEITFALALAKRSANHDRSGSGARARYCTACWASLLNDAVLSQGDGADDVTRDKLKLLLQEYGKVAIWTYLVMWLLVLAGFLIAISAGFDVKSRQAELGVLGAAWVATKLTQPLRIAGTLVVTPAVAAVLKKWHRRPSHEPPSHE